MFYWTQNPTPEGLLVDQDDVFGEADGSITIREVGRSNYTLHQYRVYLGPTGECCERDEQVDSLLESINELRGLCRESIAATGDNLVEYPTHQWNRRAALQRLSRWIKEHQKELSRPREEELTHLIQQETETDEAERGSYEFKAQQSSDAAKRSLQRAIDILGQNVDVDYLLRDRARRVIERPLPSLVIGNGLPEPLDILTDAGWVFLEGYYRSAVALCRVVLEEAVKNVAINYFEPGRSIPIREDKFFTLIDRLPDHLLSQAGKTLAHKIRKDANYALHTAKSKITEQQAWITIINTYDLVTALVDGLQATGFEYPS